MSSFQKDPRLRSSLALILDVYLCGGGAIGFKGLAGGTFIGRCGIKPGGGGIGGGSLGGGIGGGIIGRLGGTPPGPRGGSIGGLLGGPLGGAPGGP